MEQVQHCTDWPRQITFPAHTEHEKMGPRFGSTLPLIKRRKRMRRRRQARKRQQKRKNSRQILKKLRVSLLRSFKGQHSKKMKGSAQGNWGPQEDQQPFRPNPNGVGHCTTTLRWLLVGAEGKAFASFIGEMVPFFFTFGFAMLKKITKEHLTIPHFKFDKFFKVS